MYGLNDLKVNRLFSVQLVLPFLWKLCHDISWFTGWNSSKTGCAPLSSLQMESNVNPQQLTEDGVTERQTNNTTTVVTLEVPSGNGNGSQDSSQM